MMNMCSVFRSVLVAFALGSTASTSSAAIIHRWNFNEGSGTNILDSVGTAHGGIVIANVMDYNRSSSNVILTGGAWTTTDYIQMPSGLLGGLTNVTIEIWATPRQFRIYSRVFDFGPNGGAANNTMATNDFYLSFCRDLSLNQQRLEHDPSPYFRIDTALTTVVSNQYHYVVTWSKTGGPSGGGLAAWYRDGVLIGSADTGSRICTNVNDTVMWLGRSHFTGDNTASANYNEMRMFTHAMTSNEVNFSRNNGADVYIAPPNQASNLIMTTNANTLALSWTPGAGSAGSVVVMRAGQATSMFPNYGSNYTGNAIFGSGQDLGSSNFVVHAGAGSSVTVTNVQGGITYHATVFSYTGSGTNTVYNLADAPTASQTAPGVVQSIALTTSSQMGFGSSQQATVQATYVGGAVVTVTTNSTYSSSATNIISVSAGGLLTANGYGSATITATYQSFQSSNTVTVVNPLVNNLKHRYPFTTDASDVVGADHGTLQAGATIANNQLVLNGTTAYVSLPAGVVNFPTITLEAWVSNTVAANWSRIWDFGNNATVNMFLTPRNGANTFLRFAITTAGGGGEQQINSPATLPVGVMKHVVVTINGSVGILYQDGVAVGTNNAMTLNPTSMGITTQNYLGKSQYADPYFSGTMDEFRIYDTALPASIIASNFAAGPDALAIAPPTTVNDFATLNPGAKMLVPVLANDTGPSPVPATVSVFNPPANGTAVANTNGKILYTHNGGPSTSDAFTYRVQGTLGATSALATVSLTITNGLRLPNTTVTIPAEPPPVTYTVVNAFPGLTFEDALAISTPPGRTNQLFVAERRGRISYIPDLSAVTPTRQVFLDIAGQFAFDDTAQGELGLMGFAFHPNFAVNGYFFVFYTAPAVSGYTNRLSRFQADPVTLAVNTNSQTIFFDVLDQQFNHNGGDLHFGPDGFLYIGMGDEGNQYNNQQNAQRIDKDLFSSLLRIDVDKLPGSIEPRPSANTTRIPTNGSGQAYYSIPASNPFVNATNFNGSITNIYGGIFNTNTLRAEIFATGFRHIWRFSIDTNGDIWVGDVGQDRWEEINVVTNGGNYGWGFYEGAHLARTLYPSQVNLFTNPPPGMIPPVYEYFHANNGGGNPSFEGDSVTGGVVYRGSNMPELFGAYLFADFEFQNLWALRRTGTNVTVERLTAKLGIGGMGKDPRNGDILLANYLDNQIQRLVRQEAVGNTFPQTLSDTGIFADLATLSPNPGIVKYEPKVAFWSDHAIKTRWFSISNLTDTMSFAQDTNWTLPTGMKWIKHFDLELDRGNAATKKRIETRILNKTANGIFGVSYKWNAAGTEAFLVADAGDTFTLNVTNQGVPTSQFYEIPSRAGCLACHTASGGFALSFTTREMNHNYSLNGFAGNQMDTLAAAGYFNAAIPPSANLPIHAQLGDTNASLESRVRSYLAVNCSQCHQSGGTGGGDWDGRAQLTLAQTGLINGLLDNTGGNSTNRLIVPGDKNHSVVWLRIQGTNSFGRMPPVGSHVLDEAAINLLAAWIDTSLTNRFYDQFHAAFWGSTNNPSGLPQNNPDGDKANNYYEFLTQTDPTLFGDEWLLRVASSNGNARVTYDKVPNLGVLVETTDALGQSWQLWNVPSNALWFPATGGEQTLFGPVTTNKFFRARFVEP